MTVDEIIARILELKNDNKSLHSVVMNSEDFLLLVEKHFKSLDGKAGQGTGIMIDGIGIVSSNYVSKGTILKNFDSDDTYSFLQSISNPVIDNFSKIISRQSKQYDCEHVFREEELDGGECVYICEKCWLQISIKDYTKYCLTGTI